MCSTRWPDSACVFCNFSSEVDLFLSMFLSSFNAFCCGYLFCNAFMLCRCCIEDARDLGSCLHWPVLIFYSGLLAFFQEEGLFSHPAFIKVVWCCRVQLLWRDVSHRCGMPRILCIFLEMCLMGGSPQIGCGQSLTMPWWLYCSVPLSRLCNVFMLCLCLHNIFVIFVLSPFDWRTRCNYRNVNSFVPSLYEVMKRLKKLALIMGGLTKI